MEDVPIGQPLVEVPLFWFILPEWLLGADYVVIPMTVRGKGPYNFLIDTGLTTNLLTPELCEELGVVPQNTGLRGMASDGNVNVKTVALTDVRVDGKVKVPKFTAAVINFPHQGYAQERGFELHGMLGMEFLEQFDVKYARDPAKGVDMVSVYRAHEGFEAHLGDPAWRPVKGIFMPARLSAFQISVDNAAQPFLALIDTGASHTILNHEAAKALGYDIKDPEFQRRPGVKASGVLGQSTHMPTVPIKVCISSMPDDVRMQHDASGRWWLQPLEHDGNCVGFESEAIAAVGEANFVSLTGLGEKGLGPYKGPLVLTGQDILTQRELLFCGAGKKMMFGRPTGRKTNG